MSRKMKVALVSDRDSLVVDYDMPLITDAFKDTDVQAEIQFWDNSNIDWSQYDLVILRSPWTYMEKIQSFVEFCQLIERDSILLNPLSAIKWNSDKNYLKQLESQGVPIVPTEIIYSTDQVNTTLITIKNSGWDAKEVVIKPTIGAYSSGVVRLPIDQIDNINRHVDYLLGLKKGVIIQPYLNTIEEHGETNMIYFNNIYSHAIKKEALLSNLGVTKTPDMDLRSPKVASDEEKALAHKILNLVGSNLELSQPLLYARLDFIEDKDSRPLLLELEITEPSLSLPLFPRSTKTLVQSIIERIL